MNAHIYRYRRSIAWTLLIASISCVETKEKQGMEEELQQEDNHYVMENRDIVLKMNRRGGAYVDFHLKDNPVNPFTWEATLDQMPENNKPVVFAGHFLCAGRWGAPSPGEVLSGIPHNGEVNTELWALHMAPDRVGDFITTTYMLRAPIEKLDVERQVLLPNSGSYFFVRETFINNLPIGRISNVVQHGTIAAPLLFEGTMINTNATKGFDQRTGYAYLEDSSYRWPNATLADGQQMDLRYVHGERRFVTTHIFSDEEKYGWITAANPEQGVLFGYVWRLEEYPWLNVWYHSVDGKPFVAGLEFGTTGLGEPYRLLLEQRVGFYGRNSLEYMDAGEELTRTWMVFQLEIPADFGGVEEIRVSVDHLVIVGRGNGDTLKIDGNLVPVVSP